MQRTAQPFGVEPGEVLETYYEELLREFGPQGWWPARTRLEVILGAILTQNTTWQNAAQAIARLREAGLLHWQQLKQTSTIELETCARPAGYFRQKARTIQTFVQWLESAHGGSLDALFAQSPEVTRRQLLALRGLGPETADAILLYAGRQPFFVADAYTRRVLSRHGLISPEEGYSSAQDFLHQHLPPDEALFNEFHALLVEVGKRHCKRQVAECQGCPLEAFLPANDRPRARHSIGVPQHRAQLRPYQRREVGVKANGSE